MTRDGESDGLRERVAAAESEIRVLKERRKEDLEQAAKIRESDREDVTWLKRALWGLVFAVILAVATYFIRLGAAPPTR